MCSHIIIFLLSTIIINQGQACYSVGPRQTVYPYYQYQANPVVGFQAPAAAARGAANVESSLPISSNVDSISGVESSLSRQLFGQRVAFYEFSSNGYNAEGGGPVAEGTALKCDFEGRPCCWANVPSPDDQIDWLAASGVPESQQFQNVTIDGKYLVAYASKAAPSDEAQFASCSVGCSSSPIRVRARHWQSSNVLLQVCQRESFPNSVNYNPLLNCQEFPIVQGIGFTEVVLPKANLVDIVFVASNFVSDVGDIAVLDNIEIIYENDPSECGTTHGLSNSNNNNLGLGSSSTSNDRSGQFISSPDLIGEEVGVDANHVGMNSGSVNGVPKSLAELENSVGSINNGNIETVSGIGGSNNRNVETVSGIGGSNNRNVETFSGIGGLNNRNVEAVSGIGGSNNGNLETVSGISGSNNEFEHTVSNAGSGNRMSAKAFGVSGSTNNNRIETSREESFLSSSSSKSSSSSSSKSSSNFMLNKKESFISETQICQSLKCTFEDGTTCSYKDTYENETTLEYRFATRFQVVKGHFMNRITGVREGIEDNYYAASFLFPRENAELVADINQLPQELQLRFHYYESTHGVQLKGCCDTNEFCPFSSNKLVSVSDRLWKQGSFSCPTGTQRLIFLCENTRTNQGACALDDILVYENSKAVKPLC